MAFVKASNANNAGGTGVFTLAISFSPNSAGNQLGILVNLQNDSTVTPLTGWLTSVTDNSGSTYTQPTGGFVALMNGVVGYGGWLLYCQSAAAGVTTITAHFSTGATAATFASVVVWEHSGLGLFDIAGAMSGQANPATTANAVASTAGVTTVNGDTIIGITIDWIGNGTITAGAGFTSRYSVVSTFMVEDLVQATLGSIAATFTASNATDFWQTGMLAFKAPVAAPPPPIADVWLYPMA